MSDAWGAVVAAVAAGVFGIAGTFAGIFVGRRQTTDQATVEHGQWLRGQRQQAFATYLEAWDRAQQKIEDIADHIDEHTSPENFHPENYEEEMTENMNRMLAEAVAPIPKPYEQLMLIAPPEVIPLVDATAEKLFAMSGRLRAWALCGWAGDTIAAHREQYQTAVGEATGARADLFQASRTVLLAPPVPGGR